MYWLYILLMSAERSKDHSACSLIQHVSAVSCSCPSEWGQVLLSTQRINNWIHLMPRHIVVDVHVPLIVITCFILQFYCHHLARFFLLGLWLNQYTHRKKSLYLVLVLLKAQPLMNTYLLFITWFYKQQHVINGKYGS